MQRSGARFHRRFLLQVAVRLVIRGSHCEKSGTPYNKTAYDAESKREAEAAAKKAAEKAAQQQPQPPPAQPKQ